MNKQRLLQLAGVPEAQGVLNEGGFEGQDDEAAEEAMMQELHPIKAQLDEIMKRYPHASLLDVTDWLSQ